jgi:hypothetical protein
MQLIVQITYVDLNFKLRREFASFCNLIIKRNKQISKEKISAFSDLNDTLNFSDF